MDFKVIEFFLIAGNFLNYQRTPPIENMWCHKEVYYEQRSHRSIKSGNQGCRLQTLPDQAMKYKYRTNSPLVPDVWKILLWWLSGRTITKVNSGKLKLWRKHHKTIKLDTLNVSHRHNSIHNVVALILSYRFITLICFQDL